MQFVNYKTCITTTNKRKAGWRKLKIRNKFDTIDFMGLASIIDGNNIVVKKYEFLRFQHVLETTQVIKISHTVIL